jgi:MoxR-like ATPase
MLQGQDRRALLDTLPVLQAGQLQDLQAAVQAVAATGPVLDYLQDLLDATRNGRWFVQGLSPRAGWPCCVRPRPTP